MEYLYNQIYFKPLFFFFEKSTLSFLTAKPFFLTLVNIVVPLSVFFCNYFVSEAKVILLMCQSVLMPALHH